MMKVIKNEHLKPVFETMIPALNSAGIDVWVYGGVAIAGINGDFVRENDDVDACVLGEENFEKAKSILSNLCDENGDWSLKLFPSLPKTGRPKINVYIAGNETEVLSLIPAYENKNTIEFRWRDLISFPKDEFTLCSVSVGDYSFTMPPPEIVKNLFVHYMKHDKKSIKNPKYKDDVRVLESLGLLSAEEYVSLPK